MLAVARTAAVVSAHAVLAAAQASSSTESDAPVYGRQPVDSPSKSGVSCGASCIAGIVAGIVGFFLLLALVYAFIKMHHSNERFTRAATKGPSLAECSRLLGVGSFALAEIVNAGIVKERQAGGAAATNDIIYAMARRCVEMQMQTSNGSDSCKRSLAAKIRKAFYKPAEKAPVDEAGAESSRGGQGIPAAPKGVESERDRNKDFATEVARMKLGSRGDIAAVARNCRNKLSPDVDTHDHLPLIALAAALWLPDSDKRLERACYLGFTAAEVAAFRSYLAAYALYSNKYDPENGLLAKVSAAASPRSAPNASAPDFGGNDSFAGSVNNASFGASFLGNSTFGSSNFDSTSGAGGRAKLNVLTHIDQDLFSRAYEHAKGAPPPDVLLSKLFFEPGQKLETAVVTRNIGTPTDSRFRSFAHYCAKLYVEGARASQRFLLFLPFAVMFLVFSLHNYGLNEGFFFTETTTQSLAMERFPPLPDTFPASCEPNCEFWSHLFQDVAEVALVEDLQNWMLGPMLKTFWPNVTGDGTAPLRLSTMALGALKVRQVRVNEEQDSKLFGAYFEDDDPEPDEQALIQSWFVAGGLTVRNPPWGNSKRNKLTYGPRVVNTSTGVTQHVVDAFRYRTSGELNASAARFTGKVANYPSDGHALILPYELTYTEAKAVIEKVLALKWVDFKTRAVIVEALLYSRNLQAFSRIRFVYETTAGGIILPTYDSRAFALWEWTHFPVVQWVFAGVYGLWCFLITIPTGLLTFFYKRPTGIMRRKRMSGVSAYARSLWEVAHDGGLVMEVGLSLMLLLSWSHRFWWLFEDFDRYGDHIVQVQYFPPGLDTVAWLAQRIATYDTITAPLIFGIVLKFLSIQPAFAVLANTLRKAAYELALLLFALVVILIGFALAGYIAFGPTLEQYQDLPKAFGATLLAMVGEYDYEAWKSAHLSFTPLYFAFFQLALVILLLSLVITVVMDSFDEAVEETYDPAPLYALMANDPRVTIRRPSILETLRSMPLTNALRRLSYLAFYRIKWAVWRLERVCECTEYVHRHYNLQLVLEDLYRQDHYRHWKAVFVAVESIQYGTPLHSVVGHFHLNLQRLQMHGQGFDSLRHRLATVDVDALNEAVQADFLARNPSARDQLEDPSLDPSPFLSPNGSTAPAGGAGSARAVFRAGPTSQQAFNNGECRSKSLWRQLEGEFGEEEVDWVLLLFQEMPNYHLKVKSSALIPTLLERRDLWRREVDSFSVSDEHSMSLRVAYQRLTGLRERLLGALIERMTDTADPVTPRLMLRNGGFRPLVTERQRDGILRELERAVDTRTMSVPLKEFVLQWNSHGVGIPRRMEVEWFAHEAEFLPLAEVRRNPDTQVDEHVLSWLTVVGLLDQGVEAWHRRRQQELSLGWPTRDLASFVNAVWRKSGGSFNIEELVCVRHIHRDGAADIEHRVPEPSLAHDAQRIASLAETQQRLADAEARGPLSDDDDDDIGGEADYQLMELRRAAVVATERLRNGFSAQYSDVNLEKEPRLAAAEGLDFGRFFSLITKAPDSHSHFSFIEHFARAERDAVRDTHRFFYFILFVVLFTLMVTLNRGLGEGSNLKVGIQELLSTQQYVFPHVNKTDAMFVTIDSFDQWTAWFKDVVVPTLYAASDGTGRVGLPDLPTTAVGAIKVRQIRHDFQSCSRQLDGLTKLDGTASTENITAEQREWYRTVRIPQYFSGTDCVHRHDKDTDAFQPTNASMLADPAVSNRFKLAFESRSCKDLRGAGTMEDRDSNIYACDGFSVVFPLAMQGSDVSATFDQLLANGWVDVRTVALLTDIAFFNYNTNLFSRWEFLLRTDLSGAFVPLTKHIQFRIWTHASAWAYVVLSFFMLALLVQLYFYVSDSVALVRGVLTRPFATWRSLLRHPPIDVPWAYNTVLVGFVLVGLIMRFIAIARGTSKVEIYDADNVVENVESLSELHNALDVVDACTCVLVYGRLLVYLRTVEGLNTLARTLELAAKEVLALLLVFIFAFGGFALIAHVTFGPAFWPLATYSRALTSLMFVLLGDPFDFIRLSELFPITSAIFYAAFLVTCLFILFNLVVGVLNAAFSRAESEAFDFKPFLATLREDPEAVRFFDDRHDNFFRRVWENVKLEAQLALDATAYFVTVVISGHQSVVVRRRKLERNPLYFWERVTDLLASPNPAHSWYEFQVAMLGAHQDAALMTAGRASSDDVFTNAEKKFFHNQFGLNDRELEGMGLTVDEGADAGYPLGHEAGDVSQFPFAGYVNSTDVEQPYRQKADRRVCRVADVCRAAFGEDLDDCWALAEIAAAVLEVPLFLPIRGMMVAMHQYRRQSAPYDRCTVARLDKLAEEVERLSIYYRDLDPAAGLRFVDSAATVAEHDASHDPTSGGAFPTAAPAGAAGARASLLQHRSRRPSRAPSSVVITTLVSPTKQGEDNSFNLSPPLSPPQPGLGGADGSPAKPRRGSVVVELHGDDRRESLGQAIGDALGLGEEETAATGPAKNAVVLRARQRLPRGVVLRQEEGIIGGLPPLRNVRGLQPNRDESMLPMVNCGIDVGGATADDDCWGLGPAFDAARTVQAQPTQPAR